jgi:hypothetical protein
MEGEYTGMNIETPHRIPHKKVVYLFSNRTLSIHAKIAVQFEVSIQIGGFVVAFSVSLICANIAVPQTPLVRYLVSKDHDFPSEEDADLGA